YAVKANPAPEIIAKLADLGSCFDVASRGEIDLCLAAGVSGERISFGNTIKKQVDIAYAFEKGVRLFAFDSDGELDKLAAGAPGASVFCRILTDGQGADWPLSRKFGCATSMAAALLLRAKEKGLDPCGISFHVGSQQTALQAWDKAVGAAARRSVAWGTAAFSWACSTSGVASRPASGPAGRRQGVAPAPA